VVGAGVFGVAAALDLRRRGWQVALLDPGPLPHPDASSTDISKAIRMDYGSDDLYAALAEEALAGWDRWNERWGERLYHEDGVLFLSSGKMRRGGFEHDSFHLLRGRGHRLDRLDPESLRRRFPAWAAGRYVDGYFNPRGGWAESGRVVARLLAEAREAGVEVREGVRCASVAEEGSRVTGIVDGEGEIHRAPVTVVAAGAATPWILPHLSGALRAVGQPVFHFRPDDPGLFSPPRFSVFCADISSTGWYGFPANAQGIVKVANHGPGREVGPGDARGVDPGDEARFRAFFRESLPALAQAPVAATRLCLYEDSWDGNFWIDHDPDRTGLVVASGGSGHAFKFAPVLGTIIADVVERKQNPYAARFAWRMPGRRATEEARYDGSTPRV